MGWESKSTHLLNVKGWPGVKDRRARLGANYWRGGHTWASTAWEGECDIIMVNQGGLNLVQDPGSFSKMVSQTVQSILGFEQQVLKLKLWCLGSSAGNNMLDFREV